MPKFSEGDDCWGNLKHPNVYALDTLAGYPKGTIYREGFRTFVYTYRHAAFSDGSTSDNLSPPGNFLESASLRKTLTDAGISGAVDAYTVTLNYGASACAANKYAGGTLGCFPAVGMDYNWSRYIISNTLKDSDNYVTFTLDGPNLVAVASGDDFIIVEGQYDSVCCSSTYDVDGVGDYSPTVGMAVIKQVLERYTWLQTGGPCAMTHPNQSFEGDHAYDLPVYYCLGMCNRTDVQTAGSATVRGRDPASCQCIGHIMGSSQTNGRNSAPVVDTVGQTLWLTILN